MKYDWSVTLLLVGLFMISQIVGLALVSADIRETVTPSGEVVAVHPKMTAIGPRPELTGGGSFLYVLSGVFVGTMLLLLIVRFAKVNYWKILFFIAVITTTTVALGVFLSPLHALIAALALTLLKIFRPNIVVHNITELLIYAGIAVLFVPLFDIVWITFLLLVISAYDAFAVWQSRHMVTLAKFQAGSGLFAGLIVNTGRGVRMKASGRARKGKTRGAILGGGDIAFPLIFSGVVMESMLSLGKTAAFLKTLVIPFVLAVILFLLLVKGKQGKFYPAMPFLTAGCLLGLGIVMLA